MKRWSFVGVAVFLLITLATGSGVAQVTAGTIFGSVSDESQGVLPGATVSITNVDTGVTRTVVTDREGRYRAPSLLVGSYEVQAELTGFKMAIRRGIVLTVGREAEVSFALDVGNLTESVEVSGEAPLVNTTSSQLADLVDQQQIRELPLNARSYTDLALLQPGVMTTSRSGGFSTINGSGVKLSISGARPMNTAFYVDGMDVKDAFGRTPGSAAGTTLGVDAIREFQVLVSSFSAEYGGSGGVLNSVTKSGTNELHGSAFYFLRHSALDAPNFFDTDDEPPPFHRHQGGFTLGGPILKNRTFFFGSSETLHEKLTTNDTITVPGPALRAGITPTGTVTVHPTTRAFLGAMPLPNGRIFADGTGEFTTERVRPVAQQYAMARVDHQLGDGDSLAVRYTYDRADLTEPLAFPEFTLEGETYNQYVTAEYNRIVSSSLLNTLRFSVNRSKGVSKNAGLGADPSLALVPVGDRLGPQLNVPGISSWGNDGQSDRGSTLLAFQLGEKVSWTRGRHSLVGGLELARVHFDTYAMGRRYGRLRFSSMNNFLRGIPQTWEFLVPGTGEPRFFRQHQFALFAQDDFRVRPNLTLNVGLRWEFVNTPTEVNGDVSNLRHFMDATEVIGDPFFLTEKRNLGPRIGLAWDPTGDGKTSIRGGFGVFYQPLNYPTWAFSAMQNAPFFIRTQIPDPSYPPTADVDPAKLPPGNPTPMEFEPHTPHYMQFNATVQRQLSADTVVTASYAGSRGRNLPSTMNFNVAQFELRPDGSKFWPENSQRFNPAYGTIDLRAFVAESEYNSLQLRAVKRFGGGLQLQSSYTFGRNMDHTSETTGAGISDAYDIDRDWGLSAWDVRHNWTLNYIFAVPFGSGNGWARAVLGGWQTSGILTMSTGTPGTAALGFDRDRDQSFLASLQINDRPNLKPGANPNPVLGGPDQYYDSASFELPAAGTQGNVPRNTLITPRLATFDMSMVKTIRFGQNRSIQLRAEFFNLFNRTNFGTPNRTVFTSATGVPSPSFGRITSTSTTARQGQLAIKVLF